MIIRFATLVIGVAFFVFGISDLIVPRARFVSANPPAGSTVADVPSFVIVAFSKELAPDSSMDVASTIKLLPSGEFEYLRGGSVVTKAELNPADPGKKSMRADLRSGLHKGLYWVSWQATTARWRTVSYGQTYFAVGKAAPETITREMNGNFVEHNYQWRSRRAALVGGLVLVILGVYLGRKNSIPS